MPPLWANFQMMCFGLLLILPQWCWKSLSYMFSLWKVGLFWLWLSCWGHIYFFSPDLKSVVLWSYDLPATVKGPLSQSAVTCLLRIVHFSAQLELQILCVTSSQGLWQLSFRNMLSDKERCIISQIMQSLLFVFNYPPVGNNNSGFSYVLVWCKVEAFNHMYISSFLKAGFFPVCSQSLQPQGKLCTLPLLI